MSEERKSIFITGAAAGMGRATARLFAEKGWFVGMYDVNEEGLSTLASEIGTENCHMARLDVADQANYQSVLKAFDAAAGGRLDVLHNNAGIIHGGLFGQMDFAENEKIIQVNLMGVMYGIHAAYPMLQKTPNSLSFITSSSSAIFGAPGLVAYSASKYALRGMTEALSVELSLIDSRAADTLPGHIKTDMMDKDFEKNLPKEGPWRLVPAEAVAEAVWAAYHDKTGKLHWYVPEDLAAYEQYITKDLETERDGRKRGFIAQVKQAVKNNS